MFSLTEVILGPLTVLLLSLEIISRSLSSLSYHLFLNVLIEETLCLNLPKKITNRKRNWGNISHVFLVKTTHADVQVKEMWHGYQMAMGKTNQNFHSSVEFATDSVAFPWIDMWIHNMLLYFVLGL